VQTQIKFLVGGANSAIGGYSAGDILRCSQSFAKHLVEDVKCAKYLEIAKTEKPISKRQRKTLTVTR